MSSSTSRSVRQYRSYHRTQRTISPSSKWRPRNNADLVFSMENSQYQNSGDPLRQIRLRRRRGSSRGKIPWTCFQYRERTVLRRYDARELESGRFKEHAKLRLGSFPTAQEFETGQV